MSEPAFTSLKIAVASGGPSSERTISLKSGAAIERALKSLGLTPNVIDPAPDKPLVLDQVEAVFLALHGHYGEDGTIQQALEDLHIPYTGSDSSASYRAFNKQGAKETISEAGVRVPKGRRIRSVDEGIPAEFSLPVIVKPNSGGSSIALSFVKELSDWRPALEAVFASHEEALVEEVIEGREFTVGILGEDALPIVEIVTESEVFDFERKYTKGATQYHCPADLDPSLTEAIQRAALSAFKALGCRDYARVDLLLTEKGTPFVLEVNTLPGMTETSLLPMAAAKVGIDFPALCLRMLKMALSRSIKSDGCGLESAA